MPVLETTANRSYQKPHTTNSKTLDVGRLRAALDDIDGDVAQLLIDLANVYTKAETDTEIAVAIAGVIDSAPGAIDTLNELAAALGDDPNFATTMTNALAGKAPLVHTHAIADIVGLVAALDAKLALLGGIMAGNIDMGGFDITNIGVLQGQGGQPIGGGPSLGTNSIMRTNAVNIVEDIPVWDHPTVVTSDVGADTLSAGTDDGFADEDIVYIETDGTLPTGLSADTPYYVRDVTATTLKLAATNGGTALDITGAGTGTHTLYQAINAMSVGPITIEDGHTVTIPSGSEWRIV